MDPTGCLAFCVLAASVCSVIGAVVGGVTAAKNGQSVSKGVLKGAAIGGAIGMIGALFVDNVSRAINQTGTVLYSGGEKAIQTAKQFAESSGGSIVNTTKMGEIASMAIQNSMAESKSMWTQASIAFCHQAKGVVNAFVANSLYEGASSMLWDVEIRILLNNPKVTEIIIHILE